MGSESAHQSSYNPCQSIPDGGRTRGGSQLTRGYDLPKLSFPTRQSAIGSTFWSTQMYAERSVTLLRERSTRTRMTSGCKRRGSTDRPPPWKVQRRPGGVARVPAALEKLMGPTSTLVPISYLEIGLQRAKSVARVKRGDGAVGTGFLTDNGTLITNNHVLPTAEVAKSTVIQFNFEQTAAGLSAPIEEVRLLPAEFFRTSVEDDWSAVTVEGNPALRWGILKLKPSPVKKGDRVNIIQHPGGGPKQISPLC